MKDYMREMLSYPGLYFRIKKVKKVIEPKRIDYGKDPNQFFLSFEPQGERKDKVIFWIHGGGWDSGDPFDFSYVGQSFALEGYQCISTGYRLAPKHKYPAQIEDVCAAYKKAMKYLEAQGVDCSKVIVTGPSAGAHLAAILCYAKKFHEIHAVNVDNVIGFLGAAGPYSFQVKRNLTVSMLLSRLFEKGYDRAEAEPCALLSESHIPMLLIHSKHDGLIDYSHSGAFCERATALGIKCELYEVKDRRNTHSVYSAGMFLETRDTSQALDKLFTWIEER